MTVVKGFKESVSGYALWVLETSRTECETILGSRGFLERWRRDLLVKFV